MKKILIVILGLIFFSSCNNSGNEKERAFREFMNKFEPLETPITINVHSDLNCDCKALDQNSTDSLFIQFRNSNTRSFGFIPDTTDFYAFIYFYIGDSRYFWVKTFDKSYNKIADTSILNENGYMPATRCLDGSSNILFDKDFRFMTIDSLNYLYCDSLGEEIGVTDSVVYKNVLVRTIKIEKNGRIIINEN